VLLTEPQAVVSRLVLREEQARMQRGTDAVTWMMSPLCRRGMEGRDLMAISLLWKGAARK